MNKSIISLCLLFVSTLTALAQNTTYTISGITPKDVTKVYYYINNNHRKTDSVKVENGMYKLSGEAEKGSFISLGYSEDPYSFVAVINDGIATEINFIERKVTGSKLNTDFINFQFTEATKVNMEMSKLKDEYFSIYQDKSELANKRRSEIEQSINNLYGIIVNDVISYTKEHTKDISPAYLISIQSGIMRYEELEQLLSSDNVYASHPILKATKQQHELIAKRRPGIKFTDFTMNDINGRTVSLSEYVGKGNYVLVDFWASWCGPCRREMPTVVESYNRYHSKGYDVVGVSLDSDAQAWKNAITELGMKWHNISDLKGWESVVVPLYGIMGIPSNILLDPQGVIVASDLRGEALLSKLEEVYKQ